MVDPAGVSATVRRTITLEATAIDLLLYDWLSELIFRKDRDREVFTRARVRVTVDEGSACRLSAEIEGGVLDPARTELRSDPKAVTFHQFALERTERGWRARIVIDI
jgi:SHS2 domain-containing protein